MGKKYLETKKDTLESSVLGVWKTAIEEGDARESAARMDGRTKGYREHRSKLETNRQRREDKKLAVKKEEPETIHGAGEHAFELGTDRYAEYTQKITPGQIDEVLEMSDEDFDNFLETLSDEELLALDEGIGSFIQKTTGLGFGGKAKRAAHLKKKAGKAKAKASAVQDIDKAKAAIATSKLKAKEYKQQKKSARKQAKQMSKSDEFNPALDEKHDTHVDPKDRDELDNGPDAKGGAETAKKMKKAKEPEPGQMAEASGDKEAYKKFFNAALKKFKVSSPAELKDDQKKKFYDYIDKNWDADNEKAEGAMSQVREFKIQSMKAALAKVWGMEEGKNPFAEGELPPA